MNAWLALILSIFILLAAPALAQTQSDASKAGQKKSATAQSSAKKTQNGKPVAKKKDTRKSAKKSTPAKKTQTAQASRKAAPTTARVHEDTLGDGELNLRSGAVLVVDQETGEALYAKNADLKAPIASITKLMTAMVVLDSGLSLDEWIEINEEDVDRVKNTRSRLPLGTRLTRGELLHLALIASENRAASALSRAYPGGRTAFVEAMNRKTRRLGMQHSQFVDGTGLSSANRATASDLVKLVDAAYAYPIIRAVSTTGSYDVFLTQAEQFRTVAYTNTNVLTRSKDWNIGVSKTGFINEAGHCLVMQASIAQQKVIIILLDSMGKVARIGDAGRIRAWLENGAIGRYANRRDDASA